MSESGVEQEPAEITPTPVPPAPSVADGTWRALDPRYIGLQRQSAWIVTAVAALLAGVGLTFFAFANDSGLWVTIALAGVVITGLGALGWWGHRWPPIEYRHASYRVDAEGLEIRRGVYFRRVTTVPRSRVQHTDVSQGPLQRSHGLATLAVHTAGTDEAQVELPGLAHEDALRIRDHLLPRDTGDAV